MRKGSFIIVFIFVSVFFSISLYGKVGKVTVNSDIKYGVAVNDQKNQQPLLMDMYRILRANRKISPVVLFVHGGGFVGGDKQFPLYVKMANQFAEKDFVVFSINYRLKSKNLPSDSTTLKNAVNDGLKAFQFIKAHWKEYKIDTTKVFICGDSAGGGTVVNMAFSDPKKTNFIGCIDLWGGLDPINPIYVHKYPWDRPIFPFPIKQGTPPTCIIHGSKDTIVPLETSKELSKQLLAAGVYNELHVLLGAKHFPESIADEFIPIMLNFTGKILKNTK